MDGGDAKRRRGKTEEVKEEEKEKGRRNMERK